MSKAPAMPMYWDAYLADTTHLTTEEHGSYMLLLAAMWRRNGCVPDDDRDNARILGLTPAKWRKIKARFTATISGFRVENDEITQEKLLKTWKNTQEKIAKNAANGRLGGRPKSNAANDLAKENGFDLDNPNESIPEPEPEPEPDRYTIVSLSAKRRKKPSISLPDDWVPCLDISARLKDELSLTRDEMNFCYQQMKGHAHANDRKCVNWNAAFGNWIRKAVKDGQIGTGARNRQNGSAHRSTFD